MTKSYLGCALTTWQDCQGQSCRYILYEGGNAMSSKKGYHIKKVSRRMVTKEGFGEGLSDVVSVEELKDEADRVLAGDGRVYAVFQKKRMVICYLFTKSGTEKEKNMVLTLSAAYVHPEAVDFQEDFDRFLEKELQDLLVFYTIQMIRFKDKKLIKKKYRISRGTVVSGIALAIGVGLCYGLALDNLAIGVCLGLGLCPMYGMIWLSDASGSEEQEGATEGGTEGDTGDSGLEELNFQTIAEPLEKAILESARKKEKP